jgi:putative Mn2+ efflux pump MntP
VNVFDLVPNLKKKSLMNFIAIVLLALAMSTDAFAAAIGKGAALGKIRFLQAFKIGMLFGVIETITPLIGWTVGSVAADINWLSEWDHWIAFWLLLVLGGRMMIVGLKDSDTEVAEVPKSKSKSILSLSLTAIATSIDALVIGVGLAFIDVNIWIVAAAIGTATTVMVTIGVLLGRRLGDALGKRAEVLGGVVLIIVGATILVEHLAK